MGPFTSFTFEMASLAAKVVQRQLKQNEFLEAHILCYHNKSLAASKIKLFAEYHHGTNHHIRISETTSWRVAWRTAPKATSLHLNSATCSTLILVLSIRPNHLGHTI